MLTLVIGGRRYIGSAVVDELLGAGHEVIGLTRSKLSKTKRYTNAARWGRRNAKHTLFQ